MLVDSSGSRNPLASPRQNTFRFQIFRRIPVRKRQQPGLGQRRPFHALSERGHRLVFGQVAAAEHIAIADAVLKRNAPLPSRAFGD